MKKPVRFEVEYNNEAIGEIFGIVDICENPYYKTVKIANASEFMLKHHMQGEKSFKQLLDEYKNKVKLALIHSKNSLQYASMGGCVNAPEVIDELEKELNLDEKF